MCSLLKEAQPYNFEKSNESNDRLTRAGLWLCGDIDSIYSVHLEERRLHSRYGVWLLSALCKPILQAPKPIIGRLVGALFHWFDTTALVTDGIVPFVRKYIIVKTGLFNCLNNFK